MANAADCHLRHAESKVGTSVSVPADYFHENYTHNERYFESVMEVLDNGLVRVKWEIDATQSLVSLNDILIEDAVKDDPATVDTDEQPKKRRNRKKQYPSSKKVIWQ